MFSIAKFTMVELIVFNFKSAVVLLLFCLVVSKFGSLGSIDLGLMKKDEGVSIKDVCRLSIVRFPDKNHRVGDILHTFDLCLKEIENYSGKDKERLTQSLANRLECLKEDLKQAYYAGNIKYNDIKLVERFEEQIQLNSDKLRIKDLNPQSIRCKLARKTRSTVKRIVPLVITGTLSDKQKACETVFKRDTAINTTHVEIPTPKLDDNKDPKELIVPLTNPSTYKLDSPEADNALTQYYKVVMKCLTLTTKHQIQVFRFNKKFYDWLTTAVLPHLKDDKCYPAFGGVLRIVQTMRENDYVPKNSTSNFIFYRQKNMEKQGDEIRRKDTVFKENRLPPFVIYMIVWPLVIFLLILVCYQCFLCFSREKGTYDSDSTYTEVFYYPIEGTPSISIDFDSDGSRPASKTSYESIGKKGYEPQRNQNRQRGGKDEKVFSLVKEKESTLRGTPLKRQCSSKDSSSCLKSPGKRQRKISKE